MAYAVAFGGWKVSLAAGLSWLVFGATLLLATRARPSVLPWADACLLAMAPGIVVLLGAALLRLPETLAIVASNVVMAAVFTLGARRLGLHPAAALALWLLALDGPFLLLLEAGA